MKTSISRTLVGLLAAAGLVGASVNAQAATTTSDFTVTVNLTPSCKVTFPTPTVILEYPAYSPTAVTADSPFTVICSEGLKFTPTVSGTAGGTLVGIAYTLAVVAGTSGSTVATETTAVVAASDFRIRASAIADQRGTACASGVCTATSVAHTLTITY